MKTKKAIYFTDEFNVANAAAGAQCITYDTKDGFQFYDGGKSITVESKTDTAQDAVIGALTERITILETKQAGGVLETADTITVTSVKNINNPEKDIVIYGDATNVLTTAATITGKTINVKDLNAKSAITLAGESVSADDVSVSGNFMVKAGKGGITIDSLQVQASASTVIKTNSEGPVTLTKYDTKGGFNNQTNQINVEYAEEVTITNSTFEATGYNTVMIGQWPASGNTFVSGAVPSKITIKDVDFVSVTNNTINIDRTTDNAEVLIENCRFTKCSNPIRFRNYNKASGVNVVVKNCTFTEWDSNPEWAGAIIFEDRGTWHDYLDKFGGVKPVSGAANYEEYISGLSGVLPQLSVENNYFGPNRFTFKFENCTFPEGSPEYTSENIANYLGKPSDGRFGYIWIPGATEETATVEYDEKVYPKIEFK